MLLILIGYRGTGKSTVARHLGLKLGWEWIDADVEVELRAGKSIAAMFADEGEPYFRDLESQVLADLVQRRQIVLAAGGGVILREQNREALRGRGKVVWLQASPDTILARIQADETTAGRRPNLTTRGGAHEVEHLLAVRTPFYQQCADLTIDTEGKDATTIAAEILDRLQPWPARTSPA
jgi:shikimate kinase